MILVALDCGLRRSGVAMFVNGRLQSLDTYAIPTPPKKNRPNILQRVDDMAIKIVTLAARGLVVDHFVVEWQQVYTEGKRGGRKDPKDLLPLTAIAGSVAREIRRINPQCGLEAVLPSTWKNQLPKTLPGGANPVRKRCLRRLDSAETSVIDSIEDMAHDGWDACGLGLWKLKRFGRHVGRVFPGTT